MGMVFTPKTKESTNKTSSESWGMGFLFIFFPEEEEKTPNFSFKNSSFKTISPIRNRSSSSHLLSKAQSTVSICLLLIFITFLVFTISTFEPTTKNHSSSQKQKPPQILSKLIFPPALQGMGSLYRRGTRAMNDLVIAHVIESVTEIELKNFLRLLHRSGIASKWDILFVFPSRTSSFDHAIVEGNDSFSNHTDPTRFVNPSKKEKESGEPIWGKRRIRDNNTRLSYGSVVGFDTGELDPENALSGFFSEHVPMSLRRWACYPILLGRVRRNYKHILLIDIKEHLVLGDPLSQLKNRNPESVILTTKKRGSEVDSGVVLGGARGVRRLANAMLTEIVRATLTQHNNKKRNAVSEPTLFNQLVANEFVLKNVDLIVSGELTHELTGFMKSFSISKFPIVRRGNSNLDITYVFKKYLCSSPLDSIAYSDC